MYNSLLKKILIKILLQKQEIQELKKEIQKLKKKKNATCNSNQEDQSDCKTPKISPEGIEWANRIKKEIEALPFKKIKQIKDLNIYLKNTDKDIIAIFGIDECPIVQKSIKMLTENNKELQERNVDAVYINFLNEGSNRKFRGKKRACNGTPYFLALNNNGDIIDEINGLPENFNDILKLFPTKTDSGTL